MNLAGHSINICSYFPFSLEPLLLKTDKQANKLVFVILKKLLKFDLHEADFFFIRNVLESNSGLFSALPCNNFAFLCYF